MCAHCRWAEVSGFISGVADDFTGAEDTLTSIQGTIDRSEHVTDGQIHAINYITKQRLGYEVGIWAAR